MTGTVGARQVTNLISYGGSHLMVDVTLEDGTVIRATDLHPFWNVDTQQWVDAIDLKGGDTLEDADGYEIVVESVVTRTEDVWAYNLTVDGLHTYYAGPTPTLVHNSEVCNVTSRAARREAMRLAGIPTSMTPIRQARDKTGKLFYEYAVPKKGGGSSRMAVINSTTDRVKGHGPHWEAGAVKRPIRYDAIGRPRLRNGKAKVDYGR